MLESKIRHFRLLVNVIYFQSLKLDRKYGVRSEGFYAAYVAGKEPDRDDCVLDFSEWASVYRTWLERQAA